MNSEVKRRVLILSIGIIGMISLIIGISFAAFSINFNGTKENVISSGCLKVEMSDNGSIVMDNSFPIEDEEGLKTDAYTYTIENTCNINAYYEATLNAMEGTTLANLRKVKVALDGDSYLKPTFENDLDSSTLLNQDNDVLRTYRLDEGYIAAGETKTFNLRTWIDYDVEQISGKIENKVIIQSEARTNNTLVYNTKTIGYFSGSREQLLKNVDYKQISSESGIVESKNNTETSYYFRGTPTNTVVFGTYNTAVGTHNAGDSIRWKILNTNSDGSVNLITEESIENSTYSNVQNLLTSFYNTHLQDEETYIKTNSTFCKEGATNNEYLAKLRTESNNPTSKCNGASTFTKIGLPTVDDLMYAGAVLDEANTSYYLYNGNSFMTGTQSSSSTIYASNASKSIYEASTSTSLGVRPVITIKKDTLLSGNGTAETPYYVSGTYETPSTSGDTNKPVIVYARVEEKWSKTNKQIEISAKDNNTIAGYIVKTTNTIPGSNDTGWEASTSNKYKTVNTFDNGTYYVFAKDAAGNVSDPEQVKVERVDKVAPTCTINIISETDKMNYKTLYIESEDENIDLKGYSWTDDEDIKTSTRKVSQSGVYTAHLKDLAGNQGTCDVTIGGFSNEYEVEVIVNNGTVDTSKKFVTPNSNATFNLTSNQAEPYHAITECTNDQNGALTNNVLTVSNVTSDTTCTVTYKDAGKTTLYTDGTLIINELPEDRNSNIALHGAVTNEYAPLSNNNNYVFSNSNSQPWKSQRSSIKSVEIGQSIAPTDTSYWFYGLTNMTHGYFTNLDTSSVTSMSGMFYQAGSSADINSFTLTGLDDWNTSSVTSMSGMFYQAGLRVTTWSIGNLSNWDTSNVTNMYAIFYQAGLRATTWSIGNLSNWDTSKVITMLDMFNQAGINAATFNSIGTLDIYANSISSMFLNSAKAKATLNIYSSPSSYGEAFNSAATDSSALIVVNYNCGNTVIDNIIPTKSSSSNVVKGIEFGCSVQNEFPVSLDAQGGTIPSSTGWTRVADNKASIKPYTTNSTYGTLPTPTFRNYEFLGWYTKPEGGTKVTSSTTVTKTKGHTLYAHWNIPSWTVNVSVVNGSITGDTSKTVKDYTSPTFNVSTTLEGNYVSTVTCTNGQTGSITDNVLTVNNVTNNTTCTVNYSDSGSTVLYTDGTLIINEKASDRASNITEHGAVSNEYAPMSNSNNYVFSGSSSQPWKSQKTSITKVEIGQKIQPTNTKHWFYELTNMTEGDFTNLDTSNVTDMSSMFNNAGHNSTVTSFILTGLNNWNTSKVTSMGGMFSGAGYSATTWSVGDLSNWDTSNVTDMGSMFSGAGYKATTFDIDLSQWDTSNVTDMGSMFHWVAMEATTWSIGDLSNWDTSNVTNMGGMFYSLGHSATTWDIGDLSNWDTSNVTNMGSMFVQAGYNATTFDIGDIGNWNTSKVTNMLEMFSGAGNKATTWSIGNLSNWDTSNVTDMGGMFGGTGNRATTWSIGNLSNWDTSNVTNMYGMFNGAGGRSIIDIGTLDIYSTNIGYAFNNKYLKATLNIYRVPTSYTQTFVNAATENNTLITVNYNCKSIGIIDDLIATKGSNSNVVKGTNVEGYCPDRTVNVVVNNATVDVASKTVANFSNATFNITPTTGYGFPKVSCTNDQNGSLTNNVLTVSNVVSDTTCTVSYSESLTLLHTDGTLIINESPNNSESNIVAHGAVTNEYDAMSNSNAYVFSSNTSQPWNSEKTSIKRVEIGQSIAPTDTSYWFYGLTKMTSGDFANLNTSSVTRMYQMFYDAGSGTGINSFTLTGLDDWNTSSVTTMYQMFYDAGRYVTTWSIGDLSDWDTSSVTTMYRMFYYTGYNATSMTSIGSLDVYATNIYQMFYYSRYMKATLNIYSRPTSFTQLFYYAANKTGALITVNYSSATTNIDNIIATKSSTSNVVKGSQLD